jgi:hypothetical protein
VRISTSPSPGSGNRALLQGEIIEARRALGPALEQDPAVDARNHRHLLGSQTDFTTPRLADRWKDAETRLILFELVKGWLEAAAKLEKIKPSAKDVEIVSPRRAAR